MSLGRAVPWASWEEWRQVGLWLLSEAPGDVQQGLDRVSKQNEHRMHAAYKPLPPPVLAASSAASACLPPPPCKLYLASMPYLLAVNLPPPRRWLPGGHEAACHWAWTAHHAWSRRS